MKNENKSLIDLCASVISKNQLFSKMISKKDKQIKDLQSENERLHRLLMKKNKDYDTLYDRLLDKGEEMKEVNNSMLNMAYRISLYA